MIAALSISVCFWSAPASRFDMSRGTSCFMIDGIIWKVDALPTPVRKNSAMKQAKKPQKLPSAASGVVGRKLMTPKTAIIMARNVQKVTRPPPNLSEIQPVAARLNAPTSGPRKAYFSTSTSGNCVRINSGKPAA